MGSRLEAYKESKQSISLNQQANYPHIIDQFPSDCIFVIALGYKGSLLRDFLTLAYPDRQFHFSEVSPYEGPGSGLGRTLLESKHFLNSPFVFSSCDTLVRGCIPAPDYNWIGYANSDVLSPYRTVAIENSRVVEILEKGEGLDSTNHPYIGLCGVHNFHLFWDVMSDSSSSVLSVGESYGLRGLLSEGIAAKEFQWFDTGNHQSLHSTRSSFSSANSPNILEKDNESIWFVDSRVIKFSNYLFH